ncbi:hypothetical protein M1Q06_15955 [Planococcus sp. 11815]
MEKNLLVYIAVGALLGLFYGSIWQGIAAMTLVYIALRLDHLIKLLEFRK